jgi:hypothetical protein
VGGPPALGLGGGLTILPRKTQYLLRITTYSLGRPLRRPRRRWEDGIGMDLREIDLEGCGLDSTVSGQGPVAGCYECGDEPSGSCATELVS